MARGIWCRWRVCLCFGLARLSPGRGDNKAKAKAASVSVHSSLEDTAHTVHSSLTESCVQPERRRGARWSLSPLTWSVNFFSRAWSRLRASSNWPPSCWLARPLTRPPGMHQAIKLVCWINKSQHYSPSILSSLLTVLARSTLSLCPCAANSGDCRESRAGQIRRTAPPARYNACQAVQTAYNK